MAPPGTTCSDCGNKYASYLFDDVAEHLICRFCQERVYLEATVEEERRERRKLEEVVRLLKLKIDSLVSENRNRSSSSQQTSSNNEDLNVRASSTVSSQQGTQQRSNSNDVFLPVRRGAVSVRRKTFLPTITMNRFSVLGFENEEEPETRLVGDSIVRGQLIEWAGRNPTRRKRYCCPGAKVEDLIDSVDSFTNGVNGRSRLIVHVGTNNISNSRSEELLEKYRSFMRKLKEKTNDIMFTGILPRINGRNEFYSRAFSINNQLKTLCEQEGVGFANFWNDFYGRKELFLDDGLHLNSVGSARFGRLLQNKCSNFQAIGIGEDQE